MDTSDLLLHVAVSAGSAIGAVAVAAYTLGGKLQSAIAKAEAAATKAEAAEKKAMKVEADLDAKVQEDNVWMQTMNYTLGRIEGHIGTNEMERSPTDPRKSRPGRM